ncbi:MAG: permease [Gemmatimonadetes bacterium]|nr:permease [Gemmatimonadota bacterium]
MNRLAQDIRIALRGFRRTPTFAVASLAILGLGIGMAVAMFTTFETILLRRLPVQDQDRIAVLWTYHVPTAELSPYATDLAEVRRTSRTMRDVAGVVHWGAVSSVYLDGGQPLALGHAQVTANYFDVLGARPALGRLLRADDDLAGAAPVMVLSYGTWQTTFGGSLSIVGRRLMDPYTRNEYTIVGVAPSGLDYPLGAGCWTPIPKIWTLQVLAVARLAPGASADAAAAEFFSIISRREPDMRLAGAHGGTFAQAMLGDVRPVLVALTGAVALLLLIACVNVGNLFLLRAASRTRELAVRRALGAGYGDLVRQLVVESALLAAGGGALGVACAAALLRALLAFAPAQLPGLDNVRLHGDLVAIAVGVTTLSVLLFGVLPALAGARVNLASPLRFDARSGAETRRRRRVRDWLVASQVALALLMLAGAGLLARSLQHLERLDLGFNAEHLSILSTAFDVVKASSGDRVMRWAGDIDRGLRAIPGVTAVTPVLIPPFLGTGVSHPQFDAEGQTAAEAESNPNVPIEIGGADYFRTFGTPVLEGRGFVDSDGDGSTLVAVVSESVARRFWPAQDPLGKRIRITPPVSRATIDVSKHLYEWRTVVGVVPDTRFRALRGASPMVYLPWRQYGWQGYFAVRSSGDVRGMTAAMRRALHDADPTLTLSNLRSMDELLSGPLAEPRLSALLLSAFGMVALVLAAVGLYGVVASGVREQTREIGIRIALGATPTRIRDAIMRRAVVVAGAGACVGLALALMTTRLLRSLLFEVSPTDPLTLGAVWAALIAVALLAAYLPAQRATRIDPVQALRAD